MTPEELSQLRARLGVNTFGTFVDRCVGWQKVHACTVIRQANLVMRSSCCDRLALATPYRMAGSTTNGDANYIHTRLAV